MRKENRRRGVGISLRCLGKWVGWGRLPELEKSNFNDEAYVAKRKRRNIELGWWKHIKRYENERINTTDVQTTQPHQRVCRNAIRCVGPILEEQGGTPRDSNPRTSKNQIRTSEKVVLIWEQQCDLDKNIPACSDVRTSKNQKIIPRLNLEGYEKMRTKEGCRNKLTMSRKVGRVRAIAGTWKFEFGRQGVSCKKKTW